jgi:hypothetical protein
MTYEWDAKRARRARVTRRSAACIAILLVAGLSVWTAMTYGLLG